MVEPLQTFADLQRCCAAALHGNLGRVELSPGVRPEDLLAMAERHRVVPLCAAGLAAEQRGAFRRRVLSLAQHMVVLDREVALVADILAGAGGEFLILKGPALARQAYPTEEWRVSDDVDLWVPASRAANAAIALRAAGFERSPPLTERVAAAARRAGIEASFRHPERGRLVEVAHGWASLGPSRRAAREMWNRRVQLNIGGVVVSTLHPVDALLFGCRHGAHHGWDRLSWVMDTAAIWQKLSPAERAEACVVARRRAQTVVLGLGLRLAADLVGIELSDDAATLASRPRVLALAAGAAVMAGPAATERMPMMARLRYERAAQDAWRQKVRMMTGWVFTPTLGDLEGCPLPHALEPAYALLRPLRLLRHPWLKSWFR